MVSKTPSGGEAASVGGRTSVLAQSTQLSGVFGLIAVKDELSQTEEGHGSEKRSRPELTGYPQVS